MSVTVLICRKILINATRVHSAWCFTNKPFITGRVSQYEYSFRILIILTGLICFGINISAAPFNLIFNSQAPYGKFLNNYVLFHWSITFSLLHLIWSRKQRWAILWLWISHGRVSGRFNGMSTIFSTVNILRLKIPTRKFLDRIT